MPSYFWKWFPVAGRPAAGTKIKRITRNAAWANRCIVTLNSLALSLKEQLIDAPPLPSKQFPKQKNGFIKSGLGDRSAIQGFNTTRRIRAIFLIDLAMGHTVSLWQTPRNIELHAFRILKLSHLSFRNLRFCPRLSRLMYHHYGYLFKQNLKSKNTGHLGQTWESKKNSKSHNTISLCSKQKGSEYVWFVSVTCKEIWGLLFFKDV